MTPRSLIVAGNARLAASESLLAAGHSLDATYLAGYAAEFGLKGVIPARAGNRRRDEMLSGDLFRSAAGHNFDRLRDTLARGFREAIPGDIVAAIRRVNARWSTDFRYRSATGNRSAATQVIQDGRTILDWAEGLL